VSESVADYYASHSRFFLKFGLGSAEGHIHRPVWGPGANTLEQALCYVYRRICDELVVSTLTSAQKLHVIDLGCGVGAGLRFVAGQKNIRGTGITICPFQAQKGEREIESKGIESLEIVCDDFCLWEPPEAQLTYALESLGHASDLGAVINKIARAMPQGGKLVVCDDFLARPMHKLTPDERRRAELIQEGWQLPALGTIEALNSLCEDAGLALKYHESWTALLRFNRMRDKSLALLMRLAGQLPIRHSLWQSWKAGNALRQGIVSGMVEYRFGVWTKV
jgi:cyclopropane fatty-acyl-phospholipid synthase-like methyltransferase